jgi:hypothetical protein
MAKSPLQLGLTGQLAQRPARDKMADFHREASQKLDMKSCFWLFNITVHVMKEFI